MIAVEPVSWERMIEAPRMVRERLLRAVSALEAAQVEACIIGAHAVAAWVSSVDETATRNAPDIEILIRRRDLDAATAALADAGFEHHPVAGSDMFLDGATGTARQAVRIVFAGERRRPDDLLAAPDVTESERVGSLRVLSLESLVCASLASFRAKDRMHVRDLIDVGFVDESMIARLPPALATRLQELLDHPED